MKITVLGAGLVGLPIALDLRGNPNFKVTVCDSSPSRTEAAKSKGGMTVLREDLSDRLTLERIIADADLVVSAVPGFMGFDTLKTIITAGKDVVDIAFFPEDPMELDALARSKGVVAINDMGVAPGMSNLLCGFAHHVLDKTTLARIYVGGLPKIRQWPFEYKAVFSPIDVIEEYTRPSRFIRGGKAIEMPALSEPELMDFPGIGTLEAFNSDGLRTLMYTIDCPDMVEKTLRYPGHIEKMRMLRECGFFSYEPVDIDGLMVRPIDMTTRLLFPIWDLNDGEDITVMKIIVEGIRSGKKLRYTWSLFDEPDHETGIHSMARTTGYSATGAVNLIAGGLYRVPGVNPPEIIGKYPACVEFMLKHLRDRKVVYNEEIQTL